MIHRRRLITATLVPLLCLTTAASAAPDRDGATAAPELPATPEAPYQPIELDFEPGDGAERAFNQVHGKDVRYHFYAEDGRRWDMPAMGVSLDPELTTERAASGTTSLLLEVPAKDVEPSPTRDRVELRVKHGKNDLQPFRFGQER